MLDVLLKMIDHDADAAFTHGRRVAQLACAIGTEMGLSRNKLAAVREAAIAHDIGKSRIPEFIVNKPAKLNETEFRIMQTHTYLGYDIAKMLKFPDIVASVVLQHHEKMNGSGYPWGVSGVNLLLETKIITVADVVESMMSEQIYRSAFERSAAMDEVINNRVVLYDPFVVDTCVHLFNHHGFTFE